MEILHRIARASLNSCLFRLKPVSPNGSAVSQSEAPGSWHIKFLYFSFQFPLDLHCQRMDFSCSFCFNSLSFAMDFFI